ncbi:sialidase family protein [Nocardia aurantia]|uniref:Exo-alpha-sialidase n=1 Tax=Nocardia aurantia TaxID=2585199 RepID=A0A7K0DNI0_9NOCA|nr:sialidase family protein [Nocardia aurantia]MQY27306.1 hypothetical protein [Nocardia aurantia]
MPIPPMLPILHTHVPAMVWLEDGDDNFVRWSESTQAIGTVLRWPEAQLLDDRRAGDTPSITGRGSGAVMVWRGGDPDRRLWWSRLSGSSSTAGGPVWSPQQPVRSAPPGGFPPELIVTASPPAVGRFGDRVFLAWMDPRDNPPQHLCLAELQGDQWGPTIRLAGAITQNAVAFGEHSGLLHMTLRGYGPHDTYIDWYTFNGESWHYRGKQNQFAASSGPALASDGATLHMAWRRAGDDHLGWSTFNGETWSPEIVLTDRRSAAAPALAQTDSGKVAMVWAGATGDNRLWWSVFDGNHWSEQQPFPDRWSNRGHPAALA